MEGDATIHYPRIDSANLPEAYDRQKTAGADLWYAWHSIPTGNGLSRKTLSIVTDVEWSVCLSPYNTYTWT